MESIHDALLKRIESKGLISGVSAARVVESANRVLPSYARARVYANKSLTVEVPTDKDAYFFKQEIESYLERVQAALPDIAITQLRIRVKRTN